MGGSGSGKTRFFCKPNIYSANCSYLITDPKGELLRAAGALLAAQGYEVRVFNLIDPSQSDGYNPFSYIHSEKDVLTLIDNLIKNTTPRNASSNDPFWEKAEIALDSALMLYLVSEAPPEEQNFEMLIYMMNFAEVREEDDQYRSPLDMLFRALEEEQPNHVAVKQYKAFKQAAGVVCSKRLLIPLWLVTLLGSLMITVLAFIMILTVYGRFFKIYMYAALSPVALASFAGEGTSHFGKAFLRSYVGVCMEGAVIVLACIIFSAFSSSGTPVIDSSASVVTQVWSYLGEVVFNLLVLVGLVKSADHIAKEMLGL